MMQAEWLPIMMKGSFSEIYIMDCHTLRYVRTSGSARRNLQYASAELSGMTLLDVARDLSRTMLDKLLLPLREGQSASARRARLKTLHTRKDGSCYPIEYRLFYHASPSPVYIAIGNDISAREAAAQALRQSESRFRTIVSNTPGLFFQMIQTSNGNPDFLYLGSGCRALLGLGAECLRADAALFFDLIVPEDRPSCLDSMAASAARMTTWNWEGRIRIEKWKDIKWINLRSTPRPVAGQCVQWEGIMTNITQSKLEQAEIHQSRAQLAELSAHIQTVKEQERSRIAREIHDDVGGNLTAIKMAVALLKKRLTTEQAAAAEKAEYLDTLVDRTIEAVHRITADLRPGILDFGIVAALEWQAKEFEKQLGIPCDFSAGEADIALPIDPATALFRIVQEALTNVSKHARASRVAILLRKTEDSVLLEVRDNGRGITQHNRQKPKSFGIRNMTERASALGGQLSITRMTRGGTSVAIRIPLPDQPGTKAASP